MATSKAIVRYRSRPKARHHRRSGVSVPLAIVAGMVPTAMYAVAGYRQGGVNEAGARAVARLTGYSYTENKFKPGELAAGWLPILGGVVAHKLASRLGVNRMVRKATMGILSI